MHKKKEMCTKTSKNWQIMNDTVIEIKVILTVWPVNVFIALSTPNLHTCMHWSVEQDAKLVLVCQSTSRAGAITLKKTQL